MVSQRLTWATQQNPVEGERKEGRDKVLLKSMTDTLVTVAAMSQLRLVRCTKSYLLLPSPSRKSLPIFILFCDPSLSFSSSNSASNSAAHQCQLVQHTAPKLTFLTQRHTGYSSSKSFHGFQLPKKLVLYQRPPQFSQKPLHQYDYHDSAVQLPSN